MSECPVPHGVDGSERQKGKKTNQPPVETTSCHHYPFSPKKSGLERAHGHKNGPKDEKEKAEVKGLLSSITTKHDTDMCVRLVSTPCSLPPTTTTTSNNSYHTTTTTQPLQSTPPPHFLLGVHTFHPAPQSNREILTKTTHDRESSGGGNCT